MANPNRGWLSVFILAILYFKARGTNNYNPYPYGGGQSSGCQTLINDNSKFSASSSSSGPGIPVLHGSDVWCAGKTDGNQYLTVDLGFSLMFDRLAVQGYPGTNKSVAQYSVQTSNDSVNYQTLVDGSKQVFEGTLFNGDAVGIKDLSTPVQARYVRFHLIEPKPKPGEVYNYFCMRVDVQSCQTAPSPVHGNWTNWSAFDACTKPCYGHKSRYRTCSNPKPAFNGLSCQGYAREDVVCTDCVVAVDGQWTSWGAWSSCSQTCGLGVSTQRRTCTNPLPAHGGAPCSGSDVKTQDCVENHCPVDGGYSAWSGFSPCTRQCNGGVQVRSRTCSNPFPQHGGQGCQGLGPNRETRQCNTHPCPVHGGWGNWGGWSNCPVSCGGGFQNRSRLCNRPTPAHGGRDCDGSNSEQQQCNTHPCPQNGDWSEWTAWTQCSKSCDGQRRRSRQCNNPPPAFGGAPCSGFSSQTNACHVGACDNIVHGNWSSWGSWAACSRSCFPGGTRTRVRTCTNPAPAHGGRNCAGQPNETEQCNAQLCPIDGKFAPWTSWSTCSRSCGAGGTRIRERTCSAPAPSNGGRDCQGPNFESEDCNTHPCPINGSWSNWSSFTQCPVTCGGGNKTRSRVCDSPQPQHGGADCPGDGIDTTECNTMPCPVDGHWSDWTYTACSVTCGEGLQNRTRTCTSPAPSNGGDPCFGSASQSNLPCNNGPCPPPPVTSAPPTTGPVVQDANITKLDLVFALSATTSSFIQTYNLMRNTVNRFINTYGVNKIHYSIIVYGNQVSRVVNFNHTFPQSANELKTAINAQPSLPGPTVLRNALAETFRIFNETEGRPGAKKVLVVITDSNSPSDNSNTLTAAVRPLENKKVLVISVAIGNVNRSELLVISPNPLDVISVQSNVDFGVLSEWIMDRILRRDIPLVDIGFALSASSIDSVVIFTLMKNTISTIIERYGVGRVQFSIIVYGSVRTTQLAEFNRDFTQEHLINAVNKLQPNPNPNQTLDEGLKQAQALFRGKARENAKKVFVLLTDSVSRVNDNALIVETARLRRQGVFLLSVGFGSRSSQIGNQMNSVVYATDDFIGVPNYPTERVVVIAEAIMFKALAANVPLIDLTFALSATSAAANSSYHLMTRTVQSIVQTYGVDRIHYSVIVFGSVATRHIDFATKIPDRATLVRKIAQIPKSSGTPNLVLALQEAKKVFELREVRPNAKKVLVVILDDVSAGNKEDLNRVVHVLVNKSVLIIGVGVGQTINRPDLEIITEEIRNIITVGLSKNPDELAKEIMAIILRTSGFSEWSQWGACSRTCRYLGEAGIRLRTRYCKIQELGCEGPFRETTECNTQDCLGCGEKGPFNESSYEASGGDLPPRFAALDTSDPRKSKVAWCRDVNQIGGFIEINLGELVRVYRVATKGQERSNDRWVTSYYLSFSPDGASYYNYSRGQTRVLQGNTDATSVAFNDVNTTSAVRYVRFHPVGFERQPCMQASVFGCADELIPPSVREVASSTDAGKGILIALWILAGILTFLLLMACCYYCCWHVCCGRGKKRRGLAYKETSTEDGGYLIEDKRWSLPTAAMTAKAPEDEVQEITIEMKEEKTIPSGVILFGIETDETKEKHVTAEDVKSEKPTYTEDVGTIKSGSTMMTMSATERRKRTKSEGAAASGAAECSYRDEQNQGAGFTNEAFMRSQEQLVEPPQPALLRGRGADLRRTQSADELATLDYDMFENRRGSSQTLPVGRDGYMRIQNESRGSVDRTDGGLAMGTVDVAVAGIRTPNGSQDGSSHIYDMAGQEIAFTADNGGRNVYTLDNGGYRTEEWYTRGGRGPGQLRQEGFQEIHVEHHPIYQEITFNDEDFVHSRRA